MNVVIVTSIMNIINKPLSYTKTRSIYTQKERFEQTLISIASIRKHISNSYILLVECSDIDKQYEEVIIKCVDSYVNYYNNASIRNIIESVNKGHGESVLLLNAIDIVNNISKVNITKINNLYKLSGRYWISNSYDKLIVENDNNIVCCKICGDVTNIVTIFFKIPGDMIKDYYDFLYVNQPIFEKGIGAEVAMGIFVNSKKNVTYLNKIGIEGYVAVSGDHIVS